MDLGLNQFDGVAEIYPKNGEHNNIFYPVRGFRTASRSFIETGVGPSQMAKSDGRKAVGISDKINKNLPIKPLSDFSEVQRAKILRRQAIISTLLDRLEG